MPSVEEFQAYCDLTNGAQKIQNKKLEEMKNGS